MPKSAILNMDGDPFEKFDILGMELTADISEKNTVHYEDTATSWKAPDGAVLTELSSAAIYPISFSMKLDKFYRAFIESDLEERKVL